MYRNNRFKPMPKVLSGKSIIALIHHSNIYSIHFFLNSTSFTFLRILLNTYEHVGLFQIVNIVLGCML